MTCGLFSWIGRLIGRPPAPAVPEGFDLREFVEKLCEEFDKGGMPEASQRLREVLDTAYTSSSEWLGELGLAARDIQRKHKPGGALNSALEEIMTHVHKVWRRM